MNTQSIDKLSILRSALLSIHPLDRIPRDQIEKKICERLCYERRNSIFSRAFSIRQTGDVILVKFKQ